MNETATDKNLVVRKVARRIVPYIFTCYIINYLDRFNVSFAALEMSSDLGFSEMTYGLGASMFFVGYVFFEIPSNLIMMRAGASADRSPVMRQPLGGLCHCGRVQVEIPTGLIRVSERNCSM